MSLFKSIVLQERKIIFKKNIFRDFILTKLGYVLVECKLNESKYKFKSYKNKKFEIFNIYNEDIEIEILTSDANSEEYKDFGVDITRLWVVRILSKTNNQNITLKIDFENTFNKNIVIEASGGQGYEAYKFHDTLHSLSIGTESLDDGLDIRTLENNLLPNEIYNQILSKNIYGEKSENHFIIDLSDLPSEKLIQLQFVMSYSNKYLGDDDYTVPSVCQSAEYLLDKLKIN